MQERMDRVMKTASLMDEAQTAQTNLMPPPAMPVLTPKDLQTHRHNVDFVRGLNNVRDISQVDITK